MTEKEYMFIDDAGDVLDTVIVTKPLSPSELEARCFHIMEVNGEFGFRLSVFERIANFTMKPKFEMENKNASK